jgi:hypothetical protein
LKNNMLKVILFFMKPVNISDILDLVITTTTPVTVDHLDNSSAIFAYGTSEIFLCSASAS